MAKREATHVIIRTWLFPGDWQVGNMDWLSESINFLVVNAVAPFLYVARLDQRIYWLYLFVALLLAAWIFIHKDSEKKVFAEFQAYIGSRNSEVFVFLKKFMVIRLQRLITYFLSLTALPFRG